MATMVLNKQSDFMEEMVPQMDSLYNYALWLTNEQNAAKDLLQDTYLKAYRFFEKYQRGTNARAWLYRIMKNSYINDYRKKSREPDNLEFDESEYSYLDVMHPRLDTTDTRELMYRNLLDDDVSTALARLPENFRTAIVLRDIEGFTYEELADFFDIPIGTVRSRLHRARKALGEELVDYAKERGYEVEEFLASLD
jgi:RNA polymerase sigma-70 factor, ECF subfamily